VKSSVRSFSEISSAGEHRASPYDKAGGVPDDGQMLLDCQLLTRVTLSTVEPARLASSAKRLVS
jgi:hypothetical protein